MYKKYINIYKKIYNILLFLHLIFTVVTLLYSLYLYENLYLNDSGYLIRDLPIYLIILQKMASIGLFFNIFIPLIITLPLGIDIFILTKGKIKSIGVLMQLIIFATTFFSILYIFYVTDF